ncbi:MAG TPA: hypothetical protein VFX02_09095 [Gammaproteobacteria bacterium]|nr:hypothetical protein [Gammaproteobacteria bacterium]
MAEDTKRTTRAYNRFKQYHGKRYTGMPVGRSHKWNYDRGEWRERKLSPDEWEIFYQTTKRRAVRAPEESGVPVGTEYNWLIVSHQRVDKLDANSYMTYMEGRKFKIAHKRAHKDTWSSSEKLQRKKVIQYLKQMIAELEQAAATADLPYSVGEHEHVYGLNLRTKDELLALARDYGISVKTSMKRDELLHAVQAGLNQGKSAKSYGENSVHAERPPRSKTKVETKRSGMRPGM